MTPATIFICNNIRKTELTPNDLLPNGIIEVKNLQECHPELYNGLSLGGYLGEILSHKIKKIKLLNNEKEFICDFIYDGHATIPSTQNDSVKFFSSLSAFLIRLSTVWSQRLYELGEVNEWTYSHEVVAPICDLLL